MLTDFKCCSFWQTKPVGIPDAVIYSLCLCTDSMFIKQLFDPYVVSLHREKVLTIVISCFSVPFDSDLSHKTNAEVCNEHSVYAEHSETKCTGFIHTWISGLCDSC